MAVDPKDNVSKRLPAFPYDQNNKPSSLLMLPIVVGNEITGYLPAKATDNGDGTATLDVSGGGGGGVDPVGLKNIAAAPINPSTEDTLLLINTGIGSTNTKLDTLNAKDFALEATLVTRASEATLATRASEATLATRASETTLASLEGKDFALEATLATRATEATLATRASEATLATRATEATLAAIKTQTDKLIFAGDDLKVVDSSGGGGGVDPVGLKNIAGTPIDPATEQKQDNIITQLVTQVRALFDAAGNAITSTLVAAKRGLDVNIINPSTDPVVVQFTDANFGTEGKMFALATDEINITPSGTEKPYVLLRNPVASGKDIRIRNVIEGVVSTNKPTTFRIYHAPVVTAEGAAESITNKLSSGGVATIATAFTLPTVSAFGNRVDNSVVVAGVFILPEAFTLVLKPGDDLLVTVTPTVNNTGVDLTIDWAEV